ncbi:MAG: FAD-dependent oxidoreductase [Spirochaetia bacterium]|nr:FAD-dependent oxidoreductase [Spirochaetia bacterium]
MKTDVIVMGAGLSGLTAAALLARKGLKVTLIEQHYQPGGSCGAFRRGSRTFDQGTAMLFGFGASGFNPHRYVMNQLQQPITVIRHPSLYTPYYDGHPIPFSEDIEQYFSALTELFPEHMDGIRAFYAYMADLYYHAILADPIYMAPSEMTPKDGFLRFLKHPVRLLRLFRLFSQSAGDLLRRFVDSEDVVRFFNKLTSTYCYTLLDETPAILAVTMFMDNHHGGSYYPAGTSQQLPGKLEKSLEEDGGIIHYQTKACSMAFRDGVPYAVTAIRNDGDALTIEADDFIFSGTLSNLYHHVIPHELQSRETLSWIDQLEMTYPSVILYCAVDASVLPEGAQPIEMLANDPQAIDEKEITLYRFSLADHSICPEDEHLIMAIGPTFQKWPHPEDPEYDSDEYLVLKDQETARIMAVLEDHIPGFRAAVRYHSLATPSSIEYYTLKNGGSVAGPKQAMGQDLLKRHPAATQWKNLFVCGEGTVMGTGSPAVTISGVSAANMVLRRRSMKEFSAQDRTENVVIEITADELRKHCDEKGNVLISPNSIDDPYQLQLHDLAVTCQWCSDDACRTSCPYHIDIRGIMRRLECGNLTGARMEVSRSVSIQSHHSISDHFHPCLTCDRQCETQCLHTLIDETSVPIARTLLLLYQRDPHELKAAQTQEEPAGQP